MRTCQNRLSRFAGAARQFCCTLGFAGALALLVVPSRAHADAVTTWNNELLSVIRQTSALLVDGPPEVARQIAVVGTAMYDAVNAASGSPYQSYAYAGGPSSGASAEAAALAAGYTALTGIFSQSIWQNPSGSNPTLINSVILPEIQTVYNNSLAALGSSAAVNAGVALGTAAGSATLAARATDGSSAAMLAGLNSYMPPGSGTTPGVYVPPDATGGRVAMYPTWGSTVTPFSLTPTQVSQIKASANSLPPISSAAYAKGLLETQCMGFSTGTTLSAGAQSACAAAGFTGRTAEQVKAALFWNDPGGTIQPPGHWLDIATTLMNSRNLSLLDKARLTSLLGMGMTDAGILAWDIKYDVNLWRPITAIRNCATDTATGTVTWNPAFVSCDTAWQSEIATPPHPDYVAGHPAFSGAAATILAGVLGTDEISFCSTSDPYVNGSLGPVPALTMCFDRISDAAVGPYGSTYSRVLGGIHTPFAVDDAEKIGLQIGGAVLANANIPEPMTLVLLAAPLGMLRLLRRRRSAAPS